MLCSTCRDLKIHLLIKFPRNFGHQVSGQPAETSGQRHQQQSESHTRQQGGSSTDPEHPPLKRPKLEMEL